MYHPFRNPQSTIRNPIKDGFFFFRNAIFTKLLVEGISALGEPFGHFIEYFFLIFKTDSSLLLKLTITE
jgi:hypothetical protein